MRHLKLFKSFRLNEDFFHLEKEFDDIKELSKEEKDKIFSFLNQLIEKNEDDTIYFVENENDEFAKISFDGEICYVANDLVFDVKNLIRPTDELSEGDEDEFSDVIVEWLQTKKQLNINSNPSFLKFDDVIWIE